MIDPQNVRFDKHNKPSLTTDAKCTIVENFVKDRAAMGCPLTEEERNTIFRFGTEIVQRTTDTIVRVLDGEAVLINGSGTYANREEIIAFYTKRTDGSLAIGKFVSGPDDFHAPSANYLTII